MKKRFYSLVSLLLLFSLLVSCGEVVGGGISPDTPPSTPPTTPTTPTTPPESATGYDFTVSFVYNGAP